MNPLLATFRATFDLLFLIFAGIFLVSGLLLYAPWSTDLVILPRIHAFLLIPTAASLLGMSGVRFVDFLGDLSRHPIQPEKISLLQKIGIVLWIVLSFGILLWLFLS